jgi:circadian clock protein KaiC
MTSDGKFIAADRVPTGIPGLDAILRGGFFRGRIYMILAPPGVGKTILGNQIGFRHVASGGQRSSSRC